MLSNKQIAISVIGLFMLTISGFFSVKYLMPPAASGPSPLPAYRFPKPELDIQGFSYRGVRNGKTILEIASNRFSIRKKKIGPFSIGLIREVVFEKAVFKVFGGPGHSENSIYSSGKNTFHADRPFSEDLFRQFPVKGMTGIHAAPFAIEFYDKDMLVTRLRADEGSFEFQKKGIVLRGHVRAESEARQLSAKTARLLSDRLTIEAAGQNFSEKHGLNTPTTNSVYDLMLNPVPPN